MSPYCVPVFPTRTRSSETFSVIAMHKDKPKPTIWKPARGATGRLSPLLGRWSSEPGDAQTPSAAKCTREFAAFGKNYVHLDARWHIGPGREFREIALFGLDDSGKLAFWSFTNDGKKSAGRIADGSDVHAQAIAFEAQLPAGIARMIYWPDNKGAAFNFAVESKTKKGWNRFFHHIYRPAPRS